MKFKISQKKLSQYLNFAVKSISNNPPLPVLNNFSLEATGNKLIVRATDLQNGIEFRIKSQIEEEGKLSIPAKFFYENIKTLSNEELSFSLKDNNLTIKSSRGKFDLIANLNDDFPEFAPSSLDFKKIDLNFLKLINQYCSFACSTDQARLILTALLLKQNGQILEVVGTDGFRLSILKIKFNLLNDGESLLLPAKALAELEKFASTLEVSEIQLSVNKELQQMTFVIGEVSYFVKMIDGEYPPYEKIIPEAFSNKFAFKASEMEEQLKGAAVVAREVSNIISIEIKDKQMFLKAKTSSLGEYTGNLDIELIEGSDAKVAFNSKYLQDFINNIKPDEVELFINDKLKPIKFTEKGNKKFLYVVMPFRLNDD